MLSHALRALLITPLYHLFVAGPSKQATRTTFALALTYGSLLCYALPSLVAGLTNILFQTTKFPYTQLGVTQCHWSMLAKADTQAYQSLVTHYFVRNESWLLTYTSSLKYIALGLALFLVARFYILIIQRSSQANIATLAVSVTFLLQLLGMLLGLPLIGNLSIIVVLWILYIGLVPSTNAEEVSESSPYAKWLLNPLNQATSLSFSHTVNGKNFFIGQFYTLLPLGIVLLWFIIQKSLLMLTTHIPSIDDFICNIASIGALNIPRTAFTEINSRPILNIYNPFNALTTYTTLYMLMTVSLFISLFQTSLLVGRLRHIDIPYPITLGVMAFIILFILTSLINIQVQFMGYVLLYATYGILALIQPLRSSATK